MLARMLLVVRTSLAALLGRVRRRLLPVRRPPLLPAPPALGVYRARPDLPALPPAPPSPPLAAPTPKQPDLRRAPLVQALAATSLATAGLLTASFSRDAAFHLLGVIGASMFGAMAWVFWEQVAAGLGTTPLAPRARRRALVVMALAGLVTIWIAVVSVHFALIERIAAATVGLLLVVPGVMAFWKHLRASRPPRREQARPVRRVAKTPPAPSLTATRAFHVRQPPPAPDLPATRRRWRRRG